MSWYVITWLPEACGYVYCLISEWLMSYINEIGKFADIVVLASASVWTNPILINYTVSQKNVVPLACYNFDAWMDFDIFLAEMLPVKLPIKKTFFTMPCQITCASALPGKMGKQEHCIFPSNAVLCVLYFCVCVFYVFYVCILCYYLLVQ